MAEVFTGTSVGAIRKQRKLRTTTLRLRQKNNHQAFRKVSTCVATNPQGPGPSLEDRIASGKYTRKSVRMQILQVNNSILIYIYLHNVEFNSVYDDIRTNRSASSLSYT